MRRTTPPIVTLLAAFLLAGCARPASPADLIGVWRIDLRPTPDAPAYYQRFEVLRVENGRIEGAFYGSPITEGRINDDWGDVRFAFVTRDNGGAYHHAGVLRRGRLDGLTNSIGRDFLAVWSGERQPDSE